FALLPTPLLFSLCADTTSASAFWVGISLLALALLRRSERPAFRVLWAISTACAVHTRLENVILLPLGLALLAPRTRRRGGPGTAASAAALLLSAPALLIAWKGRIYGEPGYTDSMVELFRNFIRQAGPNLRYLALNPATLAVTLAAAYGLNRDKAFRRRHAFLLACAGAYFVVYSAYRFGRFDTADQARFSVPVLLPLAALAGRGLSLWSERRAHPGAALAVALAAFGALCRPMNPPRPPIRFERECQLLRRGRDILPRDAYIVSFVPTATIAVARRPSVSAHILLDPAQNAEFFATLRRQSRSTELVLFKDFRWYEDNAGLGAALEKILRRDYELSLLAGLPSDEGGYGFYRLKPRS
ncbi:MAG: hypothetical protein HYZ74_05595, partial [Elusimicrobia bacterium]|nr:hypothetical protein [Elusimicrobiota bacterium]